MLLAVSVSAALAVLASACGRYDDGYVVERRVVATSAPATGAESPIIRPPPSRRPIQRVVAVNQPRTERGQREYRVVTAPTPDAAPALAPAPGPSGEAPPAPWTSSSSIDVDADANAAPNLDANPDANANDPGEAPPNAASTPTPAPAPPPPTVYVR